jgi:MinD-like ATPase involved in chromosome partitioning or flagellar assembly
MSEKDLNAGKALAFHSYKGGTGKTTLVSNIAATFAQKGMKVCLLDFDLYAPSLLTYFRKTPEFYLNDLLSGKAQISDILIDFSSELDLGGELYIGFSSSKKDDIDEIEIHHDDKWQWIALKRFLRAKRELFSNYKMDYIILDTSPGIRYWSINAIAAADLLFLMMKISEMDIEGTKKMIQDIYNSLTTFGSKKFIILNKIPGASPIQKFQMTKKEGLSFENEIEKDLKTQVIGSIPCYCDVQFNKHEFLSTIKKPNHPFSKRVNNLAKGILEL